MFDKFFNDEKNKKKGEKEEEKKEKEEEKDEEKEDLFGDLDFYEMDDDYYINNCNNFRIDKRSKRIIFSKNTILNSNNLNNTKYLIVKGLGTGAFSNVYLAYAKNKTDLNFNFKKKYVLKTTRCKNLYTKQAVKEYQSYNKLDNKSKFIIHHIDFFNIPNETSIMTPCLVLEYYDENFYNYMKNNFRKYYGLDVNILLIVTRTMIHGISFLHQHGIIHCDLKPENIVIDRENKCKIIDLGSAIKIGYKDKACYMQSRYYRSPNCIVACDINPRIDYWSIGCVMYEALTMIPLFAKQNEHDILLKQLRFIEIPFDKINYSCPLVFSLWNYHDKKWRFNVEKTNLFDYLNYVIRSKNINRISHENNWIYNTDTGYCSLIKMCILDHYKIGTNDYTKQFEIMEMKYNESKFPPIATV